VHEVGACCQAWMFPRVHGALKMHKGLPPGVDVSEGPWSAEDTQGTCCTDMQGCFGA